MQLVFHQLFVQMRHFLLTKLGAARFWFRLFRLISFPLCAEATSLRARKNPYERRSSWGRPVLFSSVISTTNHRRLEIRCYPLIQIAFPVWIRQIPNLSCKNKINCKSKQYKLIIQGNVYIICHPHFLEYCPRVQTSWGTGLHLQLIFCPYFPDPATKKNTFDYVHSCSAGENTPRSAENTPRSKLYLSVVTLIRWNPTW